jgi:hypothetical protein
VDCTGASLVSVHLGITTAVAPTLNLTNLTAGALLAIRLGNGSAGAQTFKVSGTDPSSNALTFFYKTSAALINMTSTGTSLAAGTTFMAAGSSWADHSCALVAN